MAHGGGKHATLALFATFLVASAVRADMAVFTDTLNGGFRDSSWGRVERNLGDIRQVRSGSRSIGVTYTGGWGAFELRSQAGIDTTGARALRFNINGGAQGGQPIEVRCGSDETNYASQVIRPAANTWTEVVIPLDKLQAPRRIQYIFWFSLARDPQPTFYIDDVAITASGARSDAGIAAGKPAEFGIRHLTFDTTPTGTAPSLYPQADRGTNLYQPVSAIPAIGRVDRRLQVDAGSERGPISAGIYGMNFADEVLARRTRVSVRRWGGNATSRYNWQQDASNPGSDWYFENVSLQKTSASGNSNGSSADQFVAQNQRTGAATLISVPMIGWAAKSKNPTCAFPVNKFAMQARLNPTTRVCGDGVGRNGNLFRSDPTDTSIPTDPAFVQNWVRHLSDRFGKADQGGVRFYELDNEPTLWSQVHRDVHPQPVSYDELRDKSQAYAAAIKAADPGAKVFGPVAWGWNAFFWSGLDEASGPNWQRYPKDRLAHGNVPLIEWYLREMQAYERRTGTRLLDYLDVHFYPQGNGVALGSAGSNSTKALRLRSTRSLWDPTYKDESWISQPVNLIPRMRAWVSQNYPGTKLAITEYNWGGLEDINGALAQADILGIFGREGVDVATLWKPPTFTQPGAFAFQIYRNYDGNGSEFGDISLNASSPDPDHVSIYAAKRRADGAVTIMAINKSGSTSTVGVNVAGLGTVGTAQVFRYSPQDLTAIRREADLSMSRSEIRTSLPGSSITLFVLRSSSGETYAANTVGVDPLTRLQ